MSSLRAIKSRLRSIRKNEQILRAMKMVSAVKLRRIQLALQGSRPYAERLEALLQDWLGQAEEQELSHPLLACPPKLFERRREPRRVERILSVVLSTDRGLCGSLNTNLFRLVQQTWAARAGGEPECSLLLIGRKAGDFFKRLQKVTEGFHIEQAYPLAEAEAEILSAQLCAKFLERQVDQVEVFYVQCHSMLRQSPALASLLPLALPKPAASPRQQRVRLFEPSPARIADDLLPRYLASRLRQIIFEEQLSEHSARMVMMDQATKKAADMINSIQLDYNKLRQATITRELADITTGVEAMS